MSWIRKQIDSLVDETRMRTRWSRVGVFAAALVAVAVTAGLVQGATALTNAMSVQSDDAPAVSEANGPIDGSKYLSSVDVYRYDANNNQIKVDSNYVFDVGQRANVQLEFSFGTGVIDEGNQTVVYQLPDGIVPRADVDNQAMYSRGSSSTQVGMYSISKNDRTVTLNFTDFTSGTGVDADVRFDGEFSNDSSSDQKQVVFPGNGSTSTTFNVAPVDVAIAKDVSQGGSTQSGGTWYKDLTYTLTISTQHGTGNQIAINDAIGDTTNVGAFSASSYSDFTLQKRGTNNQLSTVAIPSGQPQVSVDSNGKPSFTLDGLDALQAGEQYVFTYHLRVPEVNHAATVDVKNAASTNVHDTANKVIAQAKTDNDATWTASSDVHIAKSHSDDKTRTQGSDGKWTDRINYTITVSSDAGTGHDHLQVDDFPVINSSSNIDTSTWTAENIGNVYFDHDSFSVVRVASDGSRTNVTSDQYMIKFTYQYDSATTPMFTIDNLAPLNAGEHYEISYVAQVTEADPIANNTVLHNRATTRVHDANHSTSLNGNVDDNFQWMSNDIDKNAPNGFNPATGQITWRVYVNRLGGDAHGVIMSDPLPEGADLASNVVVHTTVNGQDRIVKTLELSDANRTDWGYSWATDGQTAPSTYNNASRELTVVMGSEASQYTGEFYIEFNTTAPQSGTVTNQAQETRGNDHYTSRPISVTIGRDSAYGLSKSHTADPAYQSDGTWQMAWNITATAKDENLSGDPALSLSDTIGNAEYETESGKVTDDAQQYAVASTLYNELTGNGATITLNLHGTDQSTYTYVADGNGGHFASGSNTLEGVTLKPTLYSDENYTNEISDPANSNDRVKSFKLDVVCADGTSINARTLTVSGYHTVINTGTAQSSTQITAYNTAGFHDIQQTDNQNFITPSDTFTKQARAFNDVNWHDEAFSQYDNASGWVDDGLSVDYDTANTTSDKGRYVQFKLTFSAGTLTNRYITITDKLPDGMKPIQTPDHPVRLFRVSGDSTNDISGSLVNGNFFQGSPVNNRDKRVYYDEASNTLTFTVDTQASGQQGGNIRAGQTLFITYTVAFDSDQDWNDVMLNDKSYTNTATLDLGGRTTSDSTTVNVHRQPTAVVKSGTQATLANGSADNRINYSIDINPSGRDLDEASDTLTLTDSLGTWDPAFVTPTLDLSSVHLYQYDANASNHIGTEIPKANYSVRYESTDGDNMARRIILTVPDSMALVLTYTYNIGPGTTGAATQASISNTAEVSGYASSGASTEFHADTSSASASERGVYLYKVDADNNARFLSGAEFDLFSAANDGGKSAWAQLNTSAITLDGATDDGRRYHLFDVDATTPGAHFAQHDTLYKLVETKAPDGYALADPTYVVWLNRGETAQQAYQAISSSTDLAALSEDGNSIPMDSIQFVPENGGSIYVRDQYYSITVSKSWSASDGSPLTADNADIPDEIKVKLQRTEVASGTENPDDNAEWSDVGTYTLSKDHGVTFDFNGSVSTDAASGTDAWTYTWKNLPSDNGKEGDDARDYLYRVVEDDDSGNWKATYLNNAGISHGSITVNNVRQYALPSTGGVPMRTLVGGGAALAAAAGIALAVRRVARSRRY